MKRILLFFILALFTATAPMVWAKSRHTPMMQDVVADLAFAKDAVLIKRADGKLVAMEVEIARTPQQMHQGLMFRTSLASESGMLFLSSKTRKVTMWMKNTYIPLDMWFIDENGVIVDIKYHAKPESLQYISSSQPVLAVLEVNAGYTQKMGIALGDKVRYQAFGS